jgi:hypothetical protein
LSSALDFGADITSENVANNTGSRRVKDDAAGMVILSANTKNPDYTRRPHLYRKLLSEGTIHRMRHNPGSRSSGVVTFPAKSTGIDGFLP